MNDIHLAAEAGDLAEVARLLAEEPSRVHERRAGYTAPIGGHTPPGDLPIHCAANGAVVRLLVDAGADVNAFGAVNHTPLHRHVDENRLDAARALLLAGADPDLTHEILPPIFWTRDNAMFQLLVEYGANLHAARDGHTLLHRAASQGNLEVIRLLLRNGLDPNAANSRGWTPLFNAPNGEVARVLIEAGADIHHQSVDGPPLLHLTAAPGAVALLLDMGVDPDTTDSSGGSALYQATFHGTLESVDALLRAGADPNIATRKGGETPLYQAILRRNLPVVRRLVEGGADLHAKATNGYTPLRLAQWTGDAAIARCLQEKLGFVADVPPADALHLLHCVAHPTQPEIAAWTEEGYLTRWICEPGSLRPQLAAAVKTDQIATAITCIPGAEPTLVLPTAGGECLALHWGSLASRDLPRPLPSAQEHSHHALFDRFYRAVASPDGAWVAFSLGDEQVIVHSLHGGETSLIDCGEQVPEIEFSQHHLALSWSFDGGSFLAVHRLPLHGALFEEADVTFDCAGVFSPDGCFGEKPLESITALAFSPEGALLVCFESPSCGHRTEGKPAGWRGNLHVFNSEEGTLLWSRSIDATITGDDRPMDKAGHPQGFWPDVAFLQDGGVACGATNGCVPVFDPVTGALKEMRGAQLSSGERYSGSILKLLPLSDGTLWTATDDHGLLRISSGSRPAAH